MYEHGPNVLQGPITHTRPWWLEVEAGPITLEPGALGWDKTRMEPPPDESHPGRRPFRTELVERIRREIADGIYETPEKWDIALDRLLARLARE